MNHKNPASDTISGFWARIYTRLMDCLGAQEVYRRGLSLIHLENSDKVLDVGCGTGTFLKLLARESAMPLELVGVDASEDMLRQARKNAPDGITFQSADAAFLPFSDNSFDAAVSILTLHHMPPAVKVRAIQELSRVVKEGGSVVILDLYRPNVWWGRVPGLWLNFHSYTRGNWTFVRNELCRWCFTVEREGTVRGLVGFIRAKHGKS